MSTAMDTAMITVTISLTSPALCAPGQPPGEMSPAGRAVARQGE
jgi:hypothetical protein